MIITNSIHNNVLIHYGHTIDHCEVIAGKFSYIPITKNMSKIMKMVFDPYRRKSDKIKKVQYCSRFTVLIRDPLDRWASGIVEYFKLNNYVDLLRDDRFVRSIIIPTLCFDAHTIPQTYFLEGVDTEKCDFFHVTKDVNVYLNRFHKEKYDIDLNIDDINNSEYMDIQENLKNIILSENLIHQSFLNFYSNDYTLIKRHVKFING